VFSIASGRKILSRVIALQGMPQTLTPRGEQRKEEEYGIKEGQFWRFANGWQSIRSLPIIRRNLSNKTGQPPLFS
jgi:hypothetical protein